MLIGWSHRLLIGFHHEPRLQPERSLMLEIFLGGGRAVARKGRVILDLLEVVLLRGRGKVRGGRSWTKRRLRNAETISPHWTPATGHSFAAAEKIFVRFPEQFPIGVI